VHAVPECVLCSVATLISIYWRHKSAVGTDNEHQISRYSTAIVTNNRREININNNCASIS
jgi:hypothetical protein